MQQPNQVRKKNQKRQQKKSLSTNLSGKPLAETLIQAGFEVIPAIPPYRCDIEGNQENRNEYERENGNQRWEIHIRHREEEIAEIKEQEEQRQQQREEEEWFTSSDLIRDNLTFPAAALQSSTVYLLENPNVIAKHLFRADIVFDSWGLLLTPEQKEGVLANDPSDSHSDHSSILGEAAPLKVSQGDPGSSSDGGGSAISSVPPRNISGFKLERTVVRRLIPRNTKLDRPLVQTCHFYHGDRLLSKTGYASISRTLYVYTPHILSKEDIPWYHPAIRAWAYLYEYEHDGGRHVLEDACTTQTPMVGNPINHKPFGNGKLSLNLCPFLRREGDIVFDPFSVRLERTLFNLLDTQIRLARMPVNNPVLQSSPSLPLRGVNGNENNNNNSNNNKSRTFLKDNIIPQHLVQNTYTRLKQTYATDLCRDWVETTEPSKHVFEDLSIAAFLIELWRDMYGVVPLTEQNQRSRDTSSKAQKEFHENGKDKQKEEDEGKHDIKLSTDSPPAAYITPFPGFVDIACGNGVLVYILLREGYSGWGFDARRRKTWSIFPDWVQIQLKELIYIPIPFAEALSSSCQQANGKDGSILTGDDDDGDNGDDALNKIDRIKIHKGIFPKDTFIISNHADELTVWTPLMGAIAAYHLSLSSQLPPSSMSLLPFLSIPCCSHALSGKRFRYPPPVFSIPSVGGSQELEGYTFDKNKDEGRGGAGVGEGYEVQPSKGDLKALRAAKLAALQYDNPSNSSASFNSMYGSLTAKTAETATELGYDVEKTILRIPSTRNLGIVGNRLATKAEWRRRGSGGQRDSVNDSRDRNSNSVTLLEKAMNIVHGECAREGGVERAASMWIERAKTLQDVGRRGHHRDVRCGDLDGVDSS